MANPRAAGRLSAGSLTVLGVVALAVGLGLFAVWFQWRQTRGCLEFLGPEVARVVQQGPRVELWKLSAGKHGPIVESAMDVSRAAGLVHLRRGLLEDVNYRWEDPPVRRLPTAAWDHALAFYASPSGGGPAAVIAVDLDDQGWLTVVGRPGRLALGPLRRGLAAWITSTCVPAGPPG